MKIKGDFEESMFLWNSPEGRWRLVHNNVLTTLFEHSKNTQRKLPFNQNKKKVEECMKLCNTCLNY
uniref:Uncharacterized protein n=1 Tax=Lepeophtheirus salmonis TaxID=72036 RepID=A0A0K2U9D9_LEPSM